MKEKDKKDGYIHFSGQDQVASTLKKYYSGIENLILLKVETLKLDHLVWEQASDGNFFPHLYSSLDLSNVVNEFEITLNNDVDVFQTPISSIALTNLTSYGFPACFRSNFR